MCRLSALCIQAKLECLLQDIHLQGLHVYRLSYWGDLSLRQILPAALPTANLRLLRRTRLCEADPSPGLWPAPFSKGALAYRYSQYVR